MRRFFATSTVALLATVLTPMAVAHGAEAGTDKFCNLNFRVTQLFNDSPDDDAGKKQLQAFTKKANKLLNKAADAAPAEIEAQVTTAVDGLTADLQGAFDDPEIGQAVSGINTWATENCGYQVVDVTLVDYAFEGVPATVDTGKTVFDLTNNGADSHEMIVFRLKTDSSLEELLQLDEDEAERQIEFVGAGFAEPGQTGQVFADLKKPGRYAAVCFIPTGTHGQTEGDGPPHFVQGMASEFTVENA